MEQPQSPEAVNLLDILGIADGPADSYPLLGGDGPHRGIIGPTKSLGRDAAPAQRKEPKWRQ